MGNKTNLCLAEKKKTIVVDEGLTLCLVEGRRPEGIANELSPQVTSAGTDRASMDKPLKRGSSDQHPMFALTLLPFIDTKQI